eukprot:gene9082-11126_t
MNWPKSLPIMVLPEQKQQEQPQPNLENYEYVEFEFDEHEQLIRDIKNNLQFKILSPIETGPKLHINVFKSIGYLIEFDSNRISQLISILEIKNFWKSNVGPEICNIPNQLKDLLNRLLDISESYANVLKLTQNNVNNDFRIVEEYSTSWVGMFNQLIDYDNLFSKVFHKILIGGGSLLLVVGTFFTIIPSLGPKIIDKLCLKEFLPILDIALGSDFFARMSSQFGVSDTKFNNSEELQTVINSLKETDSIIYQYKNDLLKIRNMQDLKGEIINAYKLKIRDISKCSICFKYLEDPVFLINEIRSVFYCRECLENWLAKSKVDPITKNLVNNFFETNDEQKEIINRARNSTHQIIFAELLPFK